MRLVLVDSSRMWCGVDQVCREVSCGMRARGHEVVNAVLPGSSYQRALDEEGVNWIGLPSRRLRELVGEWRRYLDELGSFVPDVVHIHSGREWGSALLIPRKVAPVVVATRHNGYAIGRMKARVYAARFDRIFAVSDYVASVLTEEDGVPRRKVHVLRNPVGLQAEPRAAARERFRCSLVASKDGTSLFDGERPEPFRVGFIGRYVRPKGIDIAYEIARRMANEENVRFYTVGAWGDEGLRAELERLRPSNLVDLGFVTDIAGFYAFVDAMIMPSRRTWREAAGLVAAEAQVMGTPVIANDSGAIPETVVHEKNGFIVRDNDIDAFLHHIHELRDNPDLTHGISRASIADARRWESATVLDDHERAYLELASLSGR